MYQSKVRTHSFVRNVTRPFSAVLALSLAVIPAHAASSFRGFTVDDTPKDIEATAAQQNLTVKWSDVPEGLKIIENIGEKVAEIMQGDENCASISLGKQDKILRMRFYECFFSADGMGLRDITQQFLDKFGGAADLEMVADPPKCPGASVMYKGQIAEGERFEIKIEASYTTWKCGAVVTIMPGKRAQF